MAGSSEIVSALLNLSANALRTYSGIKSAKDEKKRKIDAANKDRDWIILQKQLEAEEEAKKDRQLKRESTLKADELSTARQMQFDIEDRKYKADKDAAKAKADLEQIKMDREDQKRFEDQQNDPKYWQMQWYMGKEVPPRLAEKFEAEHSATINPKGNKTDKTDQGQITDKDLIGIWSKMEPVEKRQYNNSFANFKTSMYMEAIKSEGNLADSIGQMGLQGDNMYNQYVLSRQPLMQNGSSATQPQKIDMDRINTERYRLLLKWKAGSITPEEKDTLNALQAIFHQQTGE